MQVRPFSRREKGIKSSVRVRGVVRVIVVVRLRAAIFMRAVALFDLHRRVRDLEFLAKYVLHL